MDKEKTDSKQGHKNKNKKVEVKKIKEIKNSKNIASFLETIVQKTKIKEITNIKTPPKDITENTTANVTANILNIKTAKIPKIKKVMETRSDDALPTYSSFMSAVMRKSTTRTEVGNVVEGKVISLGKSSLYIDLPPCGTGIIYGREFISTRDVIKRLKIGDIIAAKVVETENEEGYIELSLKEARQAVLWEEADEMIKNKTILELTIQDANKGGLILEWQGIQGFLPASQLSAENYPQTKNGDKEQILEKLKKFVDTQLAVIVIASNPKENKLIFSEKNLGEKEKLDITENYKIGDEVAGVVTGIVDFGVFVKIAKDLEGLVHISELDWGLVENPRELYKIGDKVTVKVIDVRKNKISLSIKALLKNPWTNASKKYKKGDIVKGVVIKFNQFGALVSIEEGVSGLIHISEFGTEKDLKEKLELGKTYTFQITFFGPKEQKMTLILLDGKKEFDAKRKTINKSEEE